MSNWRVEAAAPARADEVAAIERAAFGAASWGEDSVRQGLKAPYVVSLLAYRGDDPAPKGFLMWRRLGEEAEILTLGVIPDSRRRGGADALLEAALAQAVGEGVRSMFLEVEAGNEAARALYAKHGFAQVGERRGYYKNGADALVLRKTLAVLPSAESA